MIASDLYKEGKALQDQADRLMAQVHAASNDVYMTNDKIHDVLSKARYVVETIQNLPHIVSAFFLIYRIFVSILENGNIVKLLLFFSN